MNKPIRAMSIVCMLLFVGLLLNSTYLQYVQAGDLNSRDDNKRVRDAEYSRERGAILAGGQAVAESVPVDDQFEYQRVYRQPFKYAHLTGFYSYTYGRDAVESTQNEILSGADPRLFVNRVVDMIGNTQPKGGSVSLTVDAAAQNAAFTGLRRLGRGVEGAVVALEPSTGKILAMVSNPTYNPNVLSSHDFGAVSDNRKRLLANEQRPLINRATQEILPPGSTFKIVTAAAALESGQYQPDSLVRGGDVLDLPQTDNDLPNYATGVCGTGRITLTQALAQSCNTSFGAIGMQLGDDALREQAEAFGFGDVYLEDLLRQAVSRFPEPPVDDPLTAYSAIGQYDVAATPLQMAMVVAGVGNGGTVMRPYLVDEVRAPDLSVLDKTNPEPFRDAVSSTVARDLTQMLVETVDNGTAAPAAIPGIKVAGKTGTAQSQADRPNYAWFVSFAPADNPEVAVAVLVEDAGVADDLISGGGLAAPIAKSVMEAVINQ
ncbi:MAG TPA: penicillin-binding protein 2 [Nocardioides sp.]|uniref:peptidoglycan D,D-transpeptidase FtsI family protein n=1 Tax=Nocardioides sp. TaxID=35761 RepID=UPI002D7F4890|nr:penicillin-binding protein 2 [Nocardioides sp.]HET6652601.1 penicillin-binding protein 2 [Nocardioides sp.]